MTRADGAVLFDELVQRTQAYQTSAEYLESLRVVAALRDFSPFNAYLLRLQRPRLRFAASKDRWEYQFGRQVRSDRPAYPLVILRPFGPVDFVFDYEDTFGEDLPMSVLEPFRTHGYVSKEDWERLFHNARRRGVVTEYRDLGLGTGGWIEPWGEGPQAAPAQLMGQSSDKAERELPPVRFRVVLNGRQNTNVQYATFLHELGHLACGHLGGLCRTTGPNGKGNHWPPANSRPSPCRSSCADGSAWTPTRKSTSRITHSATRFFPEA